MDALLQATGLSAAFMLHALLPLISEDGPLTCSRQEEPSQGQSHGQHAANLHPPPPPPPL